jgi:L-ascorbate metabolism protein UlaG (beta-lactamase superfamily)
MLPSALAGKAFLADVRSARRTGQGLHLWWLGQSGFLLLWQDAFLLIDPYLSDSLTRKYAGSEKPHVRMTARVVAPERLNFVDVVTSSHNHTDHLDGETLRPLLAVNTELTIVVPAANRAFAAERLQVAPERLTPIRVGEPLRLLPFTLHAVPAAHEALETDKQGRHRFIGLVVEAGLWTIYHSGDTMRYEGMVEQLRQWPVDVALLPINGRDPARGVAGNLSGPEAVELAQEIGAELVVPCHYDMFEFNTVSPDAFVATAEGAGQGYHLLRNGQRLSLPRSPGD